MNSFAANIEQFNPSEALEEVVKIVHDQAEFNNVKINCNFFGCLDPSVTINTDKTRL